MVSVADWRIITPRHSLMRSLRRDSLLVVAFCIEDTSDIPCPMEHPDEFNSIVKCPVEEKIPLEFRDSQRTKSGEPRFVCPVRSFRFLGKPR